MAWGHFSLLFAKSSVAEKPLSLPAVWGIPASDFLAGCTGLINCNPLSSISSVHTGYTCPVWVPMGLAGHHGQIGPEKLISPRPSLVAQVVKNLPSEQETWVRSMSWEDPLKSEKATHSNILASGAWWAIGVTESNSTEQLTLSLMVSEEKKTTALTGAVCIFLSMCSVFLAYY